MFTDTIQVKWGRTNDRPEADWHILAARAWPALTLTAEERRLLARRLTLTVTGWLIANAPLSNGLDDELSAWHALSLAEWYDQKAPTCPLYATLADELTTIWINQVRQTLPAHKAREVEAKLDEWNQLMSEAWDSDEVEMATEPITRCFLALVRQLIDEETVGAVWAAGVALCTALLPFPPVSHRPTGHQFGSSD